MQRSNHESKRAATRATASWLLHTGCVHDHVCVVGCGSRRDGGAGGAFVVQLKISAVSFCRLLPAGRVQDHVRGAGCGPLRDGGAGGAPSGSSGAAPHLRPVPAGPQVGVCCSKVADQGASEVCNNPHLSLHVFLRLLRVCEAYMTPGARQGRCGMHFVTGRAVGVDY